MSRSKGSKRLISFHISENRHVLHAIIASLAFMAVWTPYRYVTPILISKGISMREVDLFVKPLVKSGIVFLCLKFLDRIPKNLYLQELGIKRDGLFKGIFLGAFIWFLYTIVWQYAILCLSEGELFYPNLRIAISNPLEYLLNLSYYVLIVGLFEEMFARGYILKELCLGIGRKLSLIVAILASACLFSLFHLPIDIFVMRYGLIQIQYHLFFTFLFSILAGHLFIRSGWQISGVVVLHGLIDTSPFFSLISLDVKLQFMGRGSIIAYLLSFSISVLVIETLYRATKRKRKGFLHPY